MSKTNKYKSVIKSSTSQLSGTYQIALSVINKNNAEINWKQGRLTLLNSIVEPHSKHSGIYQNLFTLTYRFHPNGTNKGDWFLGDAIAYGLLYKIFKTGKLPKQFDSLLGYSCYTATDKSDKYSILMTHNGLIGCSKMNRYSSAIALPMLQVID